MSQERGVGLRVSEKKQARVKILETRGWKKTHFAFPVRLFFSALSVILFHRVTFFQFSLAW